MSRIWDEGSTGEFRVVWQWREKYGHASYPVRRKGYKTRAAAQRLLTKLQSNGGVYDKIDDPYEYGRDGDPIATPLVLEFARLEVRAVGPWETVA